MEESKNWFSEHFSHLLGVGTIVLVAVGIFGSAKLDPKSNAPAKNSVTIEIISKSKTRRTYTPTPVPQQIQNTAYTTFRVAPHISDFETIADPLKAAAKKAKKSLDSLYVEIKPQQTKQARASRTYKVRPGDTLTKISRKVYGSSRYWKRIAEANLSKIGNYHRLKIGQMLIIPPKNNVSYAKPPQLLAGISGTNNTGRVSKKSHRNIQRTYTVKQDDTWWTIAGKLLGDPTKWKALKKANTRTGRVLNVGTKLCY